MSQQRPDRIKQMLHYLWQHRHLSTQQAIELFGYAEATVRRDFHYIASRYPGMVRGHGCIDFDFCSPLVPSTRRSETIDCSGATMGKE